MTHQLNRIGFIGAGRLAQVMALALGRAGNKVVAVCSRRTTSARALADRLGSEGHTVTVMPDAASLVHACDTVFITVSDDQIHPVADGLPWRAGQVALHCSGATDLAALAAAAQAGAHPAGFHPLHTFGDLEAALAGLAGCAVAIESAHEGVRRALFAVAGDLQMRPFQLPTGSRALYHASAHYAGSLVVTLMDEAVRHWARFGVGHDEALAALLPLLNSTVRAIEAKGLGPGMAGVVARGDLGVLQQHLRALGAAGPQELELYAQISLRSVRAALEAQRIDASQAAAMTELLQRAQTPPV